MAHHPYVEADLAASGHALVAGRLVPPPSEPRTLRERYEALPPAWRHCHIEFTPDMRSHARALLPGLIRASDTRLPAWTDICARAIARRHGVAMAVAYALVDVPARYRAALATTLPRHLVGRGRPVPTDGQGHYGLWPRALTALDQACGLAAVRYAVARIADGVDAWRRWNRVAYPAVRIARRRGEGVCVAATLAGLGELAERVSASVLRGAGRLPAGGVGRIAVRLAAAAAPAQWARRRDDPRMGWVEVRAQWDRARTLHVLARGWRGLGLRAETAAQIDDATLGALCAWVDVGLAWDEALGDLVTRVLRDVANGMHSHATLLAGLRRLARRAQYALNTLRALVDMSAKPRAILRAALRAAGTVSPPDAALLGAHHYIEWCASIGHPLPVTADADAASDACAAARARDRHARRNPEWARAEAPHEWRRGLRLAPLYRRIIDALRRIDGPLVVHGRDGEAILRVAEQIAPDVARRCRYVLSSRPLTTQADAIQPEYLGYLRRVMPYEPATHIDTGFAGSIPRWFANRGWSVRAIRLVSADRADYGLLPESGDDDLRAVVLADLEHAAQRLSEPHAGMRWGRWSYSIDAPGFWARVHAIVHALTSSDARV